MQADVNPGKTPQTLTVLFDGACPLCQREIAHLRGLAERHADSALCFVDISAPGGAHGFSDADRARLLARFHVQLPDGSRRDGAAAFVALWARLPGWRWLARVARAPGMLALMERMYRGFLRVRPALQRLVRRWEAVR